MAIFLKISGSAREYCIPTGGGAATSEDSNTLLHEREGGDWRNYFTPIFALQVLDRRRKESGSRCTNFGMMYLDAHCFPVTSGHGNSLCA
jgi:hypothetical protein